MGGGADVRGRCNKGWYTDTRNCARTEKRFEGEAENSRQHSPEQKSKSVFRNQISDLAHLLLKDDFMTYFT